MESSTYIAPGRCVPIQARHHRWLGSFLDEEKEGLLQDWLKPVLRNTYTPVYRHAQECDARHPLNQILYSDMKLYLEGDILFKVDRASMANSLEVRVPFLNRNLVRFATELPLLRQVTAGALEITRIKAIPWRFSPLRHVVAFRLVKKNFSTGLTG